MEVSATPQPDNHLSLKKRRAVSRWLMIGVFMLVIQILLGGITRLTGSGLSITEWKPIHGAVPPLNDAQWQEEFANYKTKAAGQYNYINQDFTIRDFKYIYFWEYMHRNWARLIGVVFLIGFVYFLLRKYFLREMIGPLVLLFILGTVQGAVGWIMVASGLNPEDTHVSHIKLALHFMAAMLLICYTYWVALQLRVPPAERMYHEGLKKLVLTVIVILGIQLTYGAFLAGLKAASAAPTWPDINGRFIPENVQQYGPQTYTGLQQYISHPLAVHFIHRGLAYVLVLLTVVFFTRLRRIAKTAGKFWLQRMATWPLLLVIIQVTLGVCTVLTSPGATGRTFGVFEWLAQLHQLTAMALLLSFIACVFGVVRKPTA